MTQQTATTPVALDAVVFRALLAQARRDSRGEFAVVSRVDVDALGVTPGQFDEMVARLADQGRVTDDLAFIDGRLERVIWCRALTEAEAEGTWSGKAGKAGTPFGKDCLLTADGAVVTPTSIYRSVREAALMGGPVPPGYDRLTGDKINAI